MKTAVFQSDFESNKSSTVNENGKICTQIEKRSKYIIEVVIIGFCIGMNTTDSQQTRGLIFRQK